MDEVIIRVESADAFKARTMAVARRLDAGDHSPEVAGLSFETMDAFLKIITPARWVALRTLRENGATSIRALATLLGRDYRNVHSDVSALISAGLIERDDDAKISVPWSKISAEMDVGRAA
jgi:predicted transcriptional regulator